MPSNWRLYREQTGQDEIVPPERWVWEATYSDGTVLKQFDDAGMYHPFKHIDQSRLIAFKMVRFGTDGPGITIKWEPGYKLIHFYRHVALELYTPNEVHYHLYFFGYESATTKMLVAILPNDEIAIVDDADKVVVK